MKKILISIFALSIFCLSCFLLMGAMGTAQNEAQVDEDAVLDVIGNAKLMGMCPKIYLEDEASIAVENEDAIAANEANKNAYSQEEALGRYENELHHYYTETATAIDSYTELAEATVEQLSTDDIVDGGILSQNIEKIKPVDQNSMVVTATLVDWIKCIDAQDNGKYVSYVIVNRDTEKVEMQKEDGVWKVNSILSIDKEFAPESFNTGCAVYDTYEEAFTAISAFAVENPF